MKRFRLFAAVGGVFVLGVLATAPANAWRRRRQMTIGRMLARSGRYLQR